ncbi:MAG: cobyric acid synthase [Rhodospirillaceae bacterium]
MLMGTGSDVGKSLLVAGLCRAARRRGLTVRPFKPQNMSNNAAVTLDGGEIGRAQALQARACGVAPHSLMNPVLLKPQSDVGSQVVVRGAVWGNATARDYRHLKPKLLPEVVESYRTLAAEVDLILVEGAGSPAEVNLRAGDIANMGFAEAVDLPVALIGDIDRGGVIAALVGTHALLPDSERSRIKAYIINKFRGDPSLFEDGLQIITTRTGWQSLGIVPFTPQAAKLPAEDGMALDQSLKQRGAGGSNGVADPHRIRIAVPRLSRLANFDDFDPLIAEPDVDLRFVERGQPLPGDADLVILPGSKATIADLAVLRAEGWDVDVAAHCRRGGKVLGICAGYQMLGSRIEDPDGVEGPPGGADGLGLLDVHTVMSGPKVLKEAERIEADSGQRVRGYEMHMGRTIGPDQDRAWLGIGSAASADGRVRGCYLHGLFAEDDFRAGFLRGLKPNRSETGLSYEAGVEAALDRLADHLEAHLDVTALLALAR